MKKNLAFLFLMCSVIANANVRMPLVFSDGMVLQRNKAIPVWGWADANEKVEVHFNKQTKTITADPTGKWMVKLDAEKAGWPFELTISGKNKIVITNVLVGEVWICSGQSNMEFQMYKTMNSKAEIEDSNYPMIRHFGVAQDLSGTPKEDLKAGKWAVCSKETISDFTAVGYFFAKKLYAADETIAVSVAVKNTGKADGKEVVQVYTSKSDSKITRAAKELKGFQKALIKVGTSETITLQIPVKELAYYNVKAKKWTVEPGNYTLKLGNSSRDIKKEVVITIK